MKKLVHIIHCVDTEGPLYESVEATFERLYEVFGIRLEATESNLRKIQNKELSFGSETDLIAEVFLPHLVSYNDNWEKIENMLKKILSPSFRNSVRDSFGNGWKYNWFCLDHVDFIYNPRKRDIGYHNIYDQYYAMLRKYNSLQDGLHWHFHPMSTYKEAHRCATSYINSPHLYQVLCRRIIERNFFPAAFRAGFQTERPDSHWFLEQWIPFDFSNWAYNSNNAFNEQKDLEGGRSGDWRLAPDDWSVYQPSHDNWQIPGNCRRWIARCIDIMTRGRYITQNEVDKAFYRASRGKTTLMCFNNHDFRNMGFEVNYVRNLIVNASHKYPEVKFKFCEAIEGFKSALYGENVKSNPIELEVRLEGENKRRFLQVETVKGNVFGPQPFLAIKTKSGRFIHDNFDFDPSLTKWSYTFDYDSVHADDIRAVGVAANDKYGNSFVKVIDQ